MKLIQCFSALLIAAIVKAQGVKVNATTTPPTVKDGDGCFQDGISFGSTTGEKRSDANLAVTLSSSHQIYELKACTDGTIKDKPLKGLIVTAGVYSDDGKEVEYKTKLTEFGDINPPFCKVVTFAKGERIQELTIFYTDSKVLGFGYLTNQATRFEYGQKKIDDIFNPIQIKKVTFEDQ